ncbi:hypothetical protein [Streptomyces triculaminicus]|uniref:hypothetical protein n=1 Tax=Streptomyces triculaminicus TaxID=2816232 RepID=UPI0037D05608
MGAPEEIGETVRSGVEGGWGTTARLAVLLMCGALAAGVFLVTVLVIKTMVGK